MYLRKTVYSTFLLAFALYIFLPTPDELVVYPVVGLFLTYSFHISPICAVLLTTLFYYGDGVVSLFGALIIGGKPIYASLEKRCKIRLTRLRLKLPQLRCAQTLAAEKNLLSSKNGLKQQN